MISILGAVFVLLIGLALLFRRDLLPWILSAAVPFSATAGLTVAGQSIVMYTVVAIAMVVVAFRRHGLGGVLASDLRAKPGLRPLLAFGAWSVAVTAIAPIAFSGTQVLNPREGIDQGVRAPAALAPAISNFAQSGYLLVGIATVIVIGATTNLSPRLPAIGFALGTALSSLRSLLPDALQKTLFDNSANVAYTAGEFDGIERMRGIFSEPSSLGAFSVAAVVFFVMTASAERGPRRYAWVGMGIWATVNAVVSFSGGALVTGMIVLVLVAAQGVWGYLSGRRVLSGGAAFAGLVGAASVVVLAPAIYAFVSLLLDDKASSSSYANRSAADAFSISLVSETSGIGVGLGSNRPSSFFASLLSTVGPLGLALFFCGLLILFTKALSDRDVRPSAWALIAIVVSKLTAGPDISEPTMWFLLAVCASRVWEVSSARLATSATKRAESATSIRAISSVRDVAQVAR